MKIRKTALIGAGAIGGYFIWGMADVLKDDFCVVAEGKRAERLKENGLLINGRRYDLNVVSPEEASDADLLLVSVKYTSLRSVLPEIKRIAGPDSPGTVSGNSRTIVMSLLNGIDSEEIMAEEIGWEPVVNAFMVIASHRSGNEIEFDPEATRGLFFGEKDTEEKTERCAALEDLFAQTKVRAHHVPDIVRRQWWKFMRNIDCNLPQAVLGVGLGAYLDSEHVLWYSKKLEDEVRSVAKAYGIDLEPATPDQFNYPKATRYSTLQDLDAGRHTEIDMFCGVLMKKAADAGIRVPVTECTYHLIKALEEKNDGKFNYE